MWNVNPLDVTYSRHAGKWTLLDYMTLSVWDYVLVATAQLNLPVAKHKHNWGLVLQNLEQSSGCKYIFNHRPGTTLGGSWHQKHWLPCAVLITLISLLIFFMSLLLITSWNEASGEQINTHTESKQSFENKTQTARCKLVASTDHPQLNYTLDICAVKLCLTCSCCSCCRNL